MLWNNYKICNKSKIPIAYIQITYRQRTFAVNIAFRAVTTRKAISSVNGVNASVGQDRKSSILDFLSKIKFKKDISNHPVSRITAAKAILFSATSHD